MTRAYLQLIRKVLKYPSVPNRTGINARSMFGHQMRFNLRDNTLPIITTKPVSFRLILGELLWFMRGDTNQKILERDNINIWRGNSSREYLDSRGLHQYTEYESLGPIYGYQWRHFGAKYVDCHTDYSGQGVDQLTKVINTIRCDPTDRRIIMSAWNPMDLDLMALPPCHIFIQFHVSADGYLSGHLYQRSADLMLGVPFNITSYSIMIHIIARICGLKAGELIHSMGDVHIYENHIDGAHEQLTRTTHPLPKLEMTFDMNYTPDPDAGTKNGKILLTSSQVDEILNKMNYKHFNLIDYKHDPRPIKLKMAV